MDQTSNRPFSQILLQYKLAYMWCFNPGASIPPTPATFERLLNEELSMFKACFPGTPVTSDEATDFTHTIALYKGFYIWILSQPLPDNPQEEYASWYQSTH